MKYYVDLEGKIEAKLGDPVALIKGTDLCGYQWEFQQSMVCLRPIMMPNGLPKFDGHIDEGGDFMSLKTLLKHQKWGCETKPAKSEGVWYQAFKVCIRRGEGWIVRPEAEQVDGKIYLFRYGWKLDLDRYLGEDAWIADDTTWPIDAPIWIASGDLVQAALPIKEKA